MDETYEYFGEEELNSIHLFKSVSIESIRGLLHFCKACNLQAEEVLITPGKTNCNVYFILQGQLRIHLCTLSSKPVALLQPGDSVGEMSVIDHQPTSAYVVADSPCKLMVMNEEILWSLVQSSHAAACNLLFILTNKLRATDLVFSNLMEAERLYMQNGFVDALTGVYSRYWVDNMIKRLIMRTSNNGYPLSVLLFDIDSFAEFNKCHGMAYGDHVLNYIAQGISFNLRPSELIARYGEDEFIVLLPEVDMEKARKIAERLVESIMKGVPVMPDGQSVPCPTISCGIASVQPDETEETLFAAMKAALDRARLMGGNCISE
jgi:diguanylate cyclase (GGDEF)-like protein